MEKSAEVKKIERPSKEVVDLTPSHANLKLPFGLCMKYGIAIGKDWTPTDAWNALKGHKGLTPDKVYADLKDDGKANNSTAELKDIDDELDAAVSAEVEAEEKAKKKQEEQAKKEEKKKSKKKKDFEEADYSQERKDGAYWFKSTQEAKNTIGAFYDNIIKKATKDQKFAVEAYTGGSGHINQPLRGYEGGWGKENYVGKVDWSNKPVAKEINALTKLIQDSPATQHDMWVQRGLNWDGSKAFFGVFGTALQESDFKKLLKKEFTDEAFLSTGAGKGTGFWGDCVFNIYCPKGTKGIYVEGNSEFNGENEFIIQRGSKFRLTKVEKKPGGGFFFDMEVVKNGQG